jgi:hypothetical protein
MKIFRFCFLTTVLVLHLACSESSEIGSDFFRGGSLNIAYTDTVSLKVSTVIIDSVVTSDANRLLVGHHVDSYLGATSSSAFFKVEPRASTEQTNNLYALEDNNTSYIRASLTLWYDGYSYYDTTVSQTLFVHELIDEIELREDGRIYNTSKTKYNSSPLGQLTFKPRPNNSDSIEVPLSDNLGADIYLRAVAGDDELSDTEDFTEEILKGLVIRPDTLTNGSMVGFTTSAEVRIYYLDRSSVPSEEKYLRFFVSSLRYNQVKANRSMTPLNSISLQRQLVLSSQTDRTAFVQGGTGVSMRIEMPYLKSILADNKNLIITEAELRFRPVRNSNKSNRKLPDLLKLYAVNKRNEIFAEFTSQIATDGYAILIEDTNLERDTHYRVNVLEFIRNQLAIEEFNNNALLLTLADTEVGSTVDRLYIGDQRSEYDMELIVYYLVAEA